MLKFWSRHPGEGAVSTASHCPEKLCRKLLDLVTARRPIAQIAADLCISDQAIYGWRRRERSGIGQLAGLNREE